ncbi:rab9 effector protein with kelch motifs isoform X6 [Macaca fascicularis]|uniref:rab9 effector protein with kelch motifs isoform X6 n=1 Tax=Macaca fascicularis TaxID=9541 RepID=UPI003D15AB74
MKQLPVLEPGDKPRKATWYTLTLPGDSPCARVGHSCSYLPPVGNAKTGKVFIVGGANPNRSFSDVHAMDLETLTWSQPETLGNPPSPRHGHVMVAAGTKLFIHGGLAGDKFYDDLHCIDISNMKWQKLSPTGAAPAGCAAHSAVAVGNHLYIFGGMTPAGALDTMYQYHTERQHWTLLKFDSFLPPGRLDHSMCIIPWPVTCASEKEDSNSLTLNHEAEKRDSADKVMSHSGDSHEEGQTDTLLCLVFGGMNTEGEIYDDCIVTIVD